ncbi:unnamed protein product [Closterium sp. Naga37s-1]|nr:unnamed protein product [Closterium sp. Naga37s-1]
MSCQHQHSGCVETEMITLSPLIALSFRMHAPLPTLPRASLAARLLTTTRKAPPHAQSTYALLLWARLLLPVNACAAAVGAAGWCWVLLGAGCPAVNANANGLSCFADECPSALHSPRFLLSLACTLHSRPARCSSNSTKAVALLAATPKPLFPSYHVRTRYPTPSPGNVAPPLFLACLPRLHMALSIRLPLSPPLNFPSESPLPSSSPSTSPPAHPSAHPPAASLVASSQHSRQRLWVV